MEDGLRLTKCRTVVLILRQHDVAVEGVEHLERAVNSQFAGGKDFSEAQIELRPPLEILAARRYKVDGNRLRAPTGKRAGWHRVVH